MGRAGLLGARATGGEGEGERREEGQGGEEDVLDVLLKIHKDGVIDMVAVEGVIFVSIPSILYISHGSLRCLLTPPYQL